MFGNRLGLFIMILAYRHVRLRKPSAYDYIRIKSLETTKSIFLKHGCQKAVKKLSSERTTSIVGITMRIEMHQ